MKRRDLLALGLASFAASTLTPRFAMAQGKYPERPIKLMVAFSAGGVNDVVARHWAEKRGLYLLGDPRRTTACQNWTNALRN